MVGDIDRIEAIREPGAAMWGANAVNGDDQHRDQGCGRHLGGLVMADGEQR